MAKVGRWVWAGLVPLLVGVPGGVLAVAGQPRAAGGAPGRQPVVALPERVAAGEAEDSAGLGVFGSEDGAGTSRIVLECPPDALQSRPPHLPSASEYWLHVSDSAAVYRVYDDYQVSAPVCAVRFWGFDLLYDRGWIECVEDPSSFTISFHEDAGGLPGSAVCSYTVAAQRTPTGVFYGIEANLELNQYDALLPECCTLPGGWISIVGDSVGFPTNCSFLWLSSPIGNGSALQWGGIGYSGIRFDRAFCLIGAEGACCLPDRSCVILDPIDCVEAGGEYQGDGVPCAPGLCAAPGDTCGKAEIVPGLPFHATGDTCTFVDDYDESCPAGPGAPDVVYAYTPAADECVTVTLCAGATNFDTKLYIYEGLCPSPGAPLGCNDDGCTSAAGNGHVSRLCLTLTGGVTYYIVVDGQAGACGFYELDILPDVAAPTFAEAPGALDVTVECGGSTEPAATGAPTPQDACPATLEYSDQFAPGTCPGEGVITRTWTATDVCGHTAEYVQTITIDDRTPPTAVQGAVAACYASVAAAEQAAMAATTGLADNCTPTGDLAVSVKTTGRCAAWVTVTVTDGCGNAADFEYLTRIDAEPPAVTAGTIGMCYPTEAEAEQAAIAATTATDNCTAPGDLVFEAVTQRSCSVTVTVTVTDECGNQAAVDYETWVDPEAPRITGCPGDLHVDAPPGACAAVVTWTPPTAWDNCGLTSYTATHTPGSALPVGVTTVTYRATDACGHETTCSFDVHVYDREPPVLTGCPEDQAVAADPGQCTAAVTWVPPVADDNCGVASFACSHAPGEAFPVGTTTVTCTAEDASGNRASCAFDITVSDAEPPQIVACADPVTLTRDVGELAYMPDLTGEVTAADNCPGLIVTQDPAPGTPLGFGTHPVELLVTDAAGLTAACQTTVTVQSTGPARLWLEVDGTCFGPGDPVVVEIWMLSVAESITGGQFFLAYDDARLEFTSAEPGAEPFTRELFECSPLVATVPQCTPTAGDIGYAVAGPDGGPGVTGDARLATLVFTARQRLCGGDALVVWRENDPPTRLSDAEGQPVTPELFDLSVADQVGPVVSELSAAGAAADADCTATVTFGALVSEDCCIDPDEVVVAVALASGSAALGPPAVTKTLRPDGRTVEIAGSVAVADVTACPAVVQVAVFAEDCCGNPAAPAAEALAGRWSESFVVGGPGQVGNTVHAASWDGAELGGQWELAGPVLASIVQLENTVDGQGNGTVVWQTTYTGGTLSVDAALWGGTGRPTAPLVAYEHITHQVYVGGSVDLGASWTGVKALALVPDGPGLRLRATARFAGEGGPLPADYPAFLGGADSGQWGGVEDIRLGTAAATSAVVTDAQAPTVAGLTVTGQDVDAGCAGTVTFAATVQDNCCARPEDVAVAVALVGGSATLGAPQITLTPLDERTVQLAGSVAVTDVSACPAVVRVGIVVEDCCGNAAAAEDTAEVSDRTPPEVNGCPGDVAVTTEPGQYAAEVAWSPPGVADNCDPAVTVVYAIDLDDDGQVDEATAAPSYAFPPGTHRVTVMAGDACGNVNMACTFAVDVALHVSLLADLDWRLASPGVCHLQDFDVGLYAVCADGQTPVAMSQVDVLVAWDPVHLELLGAVNNGPYAWDYSGFWDDSGLDGLNDTWADGDAYYRAVAQAGNPAEATPAGLLLATLRFKALTAGASSAVTMLAEYGSFSATRIVPPAAPEVSVLRMRDALAVESNATGDTNCDGVINFQDIDPLVVAMSGEAAFHAVYPGCNWYNSDCNCDGQINFQDIDPFVVILSAQGGGQP